MKKIYSMIHTNNPIALQSQKWIIQALLDLMQIMNYDKISVSEICRKAQLDRRTFYRNFDSKNDVLEQYNGWEVNILYCLRPFINQTNILQH